MARHDFAFTPRLLPAAKAAEKLMPEARRIEVFSRQKRAGWANWGHEAEKFEEAS